MDLLKTIVDPRKPRGVRHRRRPPLSISTAAAVSTARAARRFSSARIRKIARKQPSRALAGRAIVVYKRL